MRIKTRKIAFIGNGLDLFHNIPSKFRDYYNSQYMIRETKKAYEDLLEKYSIAMDGGCWYDFELMYHNLVKKESEAMQNGYGTSVLGLSVENNQRYSQSIEEINRVFKAITKEFNCYLKEKYCECIEIGKLIKNKLVEQVLNEVDIIITFNYTHTLEHVYGIPAAKIIYVHGTLKDNDIILGYSSYYDETVEDYAFRGWIAPDSLFGDKVFGRILKNGGNKWLEPGKYKPVMDVAYGSPYSEFKDLRGNLIIPPNPLALDFDNEIEVYVIGHGIQSDRDLLSKIPAKIKKVYVFGVPCNQEETNKLKERAAEVFNINEVEELNY